MEQSRRRVEMIDALRGAALWVMVAHHVLYDLCAFCGLPWVWFTNPVLDVVHYLCAGLLILLCGVSSNFSRSNLRRAVKTLAAALGVSVVTYIIEMPIRFGILHLLGVCMLLYGLTQRFWQRLPAWAIPTLSAAGTLATAKLVDGYPSATPHLWMFGLVTPDFRSADYFPLLPWIFVFLLGTWAGKYVREGRLPPWFYGAKAPRLAAVGRHSMLIYLLHQPVLYGLTMLGLRIFGKA